jgi:RNA polymerase sigma factor (TIGR02999 family)
MHNPDTPQNVTGLLIDWRRGDARALDRLIPLVHDELHQIAERCMRGERAAHSLQATALVNEAYLRLVDTQRVDWQDRTHFLAMSARLMRRVLVEHARARLSDKRGGGVHPVTLVDGLGGSDERPHNVIALDDAVNALTQFDERKGRVVELRFFGGLSLDETADVLDVSIETVKRDWKFAKAWLLCELNGEGDPSDTTKRAEH